MSVERSYIDLNFVNIVTIGIVLFIGYLIITGGIVAYKAIYTKKNSTAASQAPNA